MNPWEDRRNSFGEKKQNKNRDHNINQRKETELFGKHHEEKMPWESEGSRNSGRKKGERKVTRTVNG